MRAFTECRRYSKTCLHAVSLIPESPCFSCEEYVNHIGRTIKMTVTNLIDLAKAIANLPATNGEDGIAEKVAQMIKLP